MFDVVLERSLTLNGQGFAPQAFETTVFFAH